MIMFATIQSGNALQKMRKEWPLRSVVCFKEDNTADISAERCFRINVLVWQPGSIHEDISIHTSAVTTIHLLRDGSPLLPLQTVEM